VKQSENPYVDIRIATQDILMEFQQLKNRNRDVLLEEMLIAEKAVSALSRAAADAIIAQRTKPEEM
jgi:hypothetical protein